VDQSLKEGEGLDQLGGLEIIHTPGHTVGSICLYNNEKKILFSGDLIRNENGVMEGPPPQFTPDPGTAACSLEKIADLDFDTLLPGHGDPILSGAGERFTALYETREIWPLSEQ
jgi:glyoxylase-like metal-dependent hydrolase (beta-lactamase superfamily II)